MAFTNTQSVYDRYSSTGQIPILKSDLTKITRDLTNMQEYFATNSTVNRGRHAQLLLAYHSTGTNAEATTVNTNGYPSTNIALRHLKNATLMGSGSTTFQPSCQQYVLNFVGATSTLGIFVSNKFFVTVTTSVSATSVFPKQFHFGAFIVTSVATGGGVVCKYRTIMHTAIGSASAGSTAVTYSNIYGLESEIFGGGFSNIPMVIANGDLTGVGPVLSGFYKFYACDIEE